MRTLLVVLAAIPICAFGGPISINQVGGFVHANGSLQQQLDSSSLAYFSTLNADNIGTFGWTFTNTTGSTLSNFHFFGFLDADIDRDLDTFFNEYGELIALGLPFSAPAGSIAATSWQIDEPGFIFGTILNDLLAGSLKNDNFVPSGSPDDPSFALGFNFGSLAAGQTARITLQIASFGIGGLRQSDPDSNYSFYFNGFANIDADTSATPEPSTFALFCLGFTAALILRFSPQLAPPTI